MTGAETLTAAAATLKTDNTTPHAKPLAAWLEQQADELNIRTAIWRRTQQDIGLLTRTHYHHPLTVALAILKPEDEDDE